MSEPQPLAFQLGGMSDYLVCELAKRLELVAMHEMDEPQRAAMLAERGADCRVVVTGGNIGCTTAMMQALPRLGLIGINGVGFDKVDLPAAAAQGVLVSNTPDVLTEDVADLAIGLIIAHMRGIAAGDAFVRAGQWTAGEFPLGRKVSGTRFGIFGLGRIGGAIADRLAAFGPVAYASRTAKDVPFQHFASLAELARWAECLIIACPANAGTDKLVNAAILAELGPRGLLVNIARGSVVDEDALAAAVEAGTIAGAALDVFAAEPHVPAALCASPRTVLTPHVGSATAETRRDMADLLLANIDAFLAGAPLKTPVT